MSDQRPANFGVAEIIRWIRENDNRGTCFDDWPDNILAAYLQFNHANGNLYLVEESGELVAVAIGSQMDEGDIDRHWFSGREDGDIFYVSQLISKKKAAVATCVDEMRERLPGWEKFRLFALRRGVKREFKQGLFERLLAWR